MQRQTNPNWGRRWRKINKIARTTEINYNKLARYFGLQYKPQYGDELERKKKNRKKKKTEK